MPRYRYAFDEAKIVRYQKQGRGLGDGSSYLPWLTVADVPSRGRSHRVFCRKTERVHHLLSDNEYYAFLLFWWHDSVVDIKEQYPILDRRETLLIATTLGCKHPVDPATRTLLVVTTDFVVTLRTPVGLKLVAKAVKESGELVNRRVLEKLQIEYNYWNALGIEWGILTERKLKTPFTRNLAWLYDADDYKWFRTQHVDSMPEMERALQALLDQWPQVPLHEICATFDRAYGLIAGTGLSLLRLLIASKRLTVDLTVTRPLDQPAKQVSRIA